MVPMTELAQKLSVLRSTDSSPSRPMETSSPRMESENPTGQLLVPAGCHGHCTCLDCIRCIYCSVCQDCETCKKCTVCKYPPRQLKVTKRTTLSNDAIKRRIGAKTKSAPIFPAPFGDQLVPVKVTKIETKCIGDNFNLETKSVGDKLNLETKSVGDKTQNAVNLDADVSESVRTESGPVLVSSANHVKVSKLINFNINTKVTDLTAKEKKLIQFCQRRITINNRRLQVQREYRESGIIDQKGVFRLHDSTDKDFWVTISLTGYTDVIIPRCGLDLLGLINFCPCITWTVIGQDGHPKSDLFMIGQILNEHVLFDNRVSVNPIRFTKIDENSDKNDFIQVEKPKEKSPKGITKKSLPPTPQVPSSGFPIRPPSNDVPPEFIWKEQDRDHGTPSSRRRQHTTERLNLPNVTVLNGITRLIHNGRPLDQVNEEREMIFTAK